MSTCVSKKKDTPALSILGKLAIQFGMMGFSAINRPFYSCVLSYLAMNSSKHVSMHVNAN